MKRNLKILGLLLGAVFAMSAMGASAAQAEPTFTGVETEGAKETHVHTILKGTSEGFETFTAAGEIECHNTYEGTDLTGDTKDLTAKVTGVKKPDTTGEDCVTTVFGAEFTTDINFHSCDYVFHPGTQIEATMHYTGTVDVHCDVPGDAIEVTVTNSEGKTKCTIKVGAQNGLGPITYKVNTTPKPTDVTVEANVGKEVDYTSEGGFLNCGVANGFHANGASYKGSATVQGFNTKGEQIDVDISG